MATDFIFKNDDRNQILAENYERLFLKYQLMNDVKRKTGQNRLG